MAKGDDIENRVVALAVRIVNLSDNLPDKRSANHIAGQLLRSGTSPAAHYAEARGAESPKVFQHKLKICSKELNESRVWLQIITAIPILKRFSASPPIENRWLVHKAC